jgi:hypothetical protein
MAREITPEEEEKIRQEELTWLMERHRRQTKTRPEARREKGPLSMFVLLQILLFVGVLVAVFLFRDVLKSFISLGQ